ncbi:MAG TPA: peptidase E [Gaiellales bacterium]|jgi:peptidase E|nr:peptidase E [Gaiellales bacterium]
MRAPQIVAMGGGGFLDDDPALDDFVLGLAGAELPAVCFLPTASGDADSAIVRFHAAFPPERARASHVKLFARDERDLRGHLLAHDVIYVGGGNTVNMLAIWRAHGVDEILREAWQAGVVLAGMSAGSLCWFEGGVTDSYGPLAALPDGLGFLKGSNCPHYDGEPGRRPTYTRLVGDGTLPAGVAADDHCALHYAAETLVDVVASRHGAGAYRVEPSGETPVAARVLG